MGFLSPVEVKDGRSASELVVDNFKTALIEKELAPGDRIPSETEIAEMMHVSRGTVREAMKILASYGIVDIKRGDGTYICSNADKVSADPILFSFLLSQPTKNEQIEFRWYIERIVMQLAIANATEEDIEALEKNYREMIAVENNHIESTALDIQFHDLLGQATKNRLLSRVYSLAMEYCRASLTSSHKNNKGAKAKAIHRATIDAIKNKQYDDIEGLVNSSINNWSEDSDIHYFGEIFKK